MKYHILLELDLSLEQNYFSWITTHRFSESILMGNLLRFFLSQIFINNVKNKIDRNFITRKFIRWYSYVDDL